MNTEYEYSLVVFSALLNHFVDFESPNTPLGASTVYQNDISLEEGACGLRGCSVVS